MRNNIICGTRVCHADSSVRCAPPSIAAARSDFHVARRAERQLIGTNQKTHFCSALRIPAPSKSRRDSAGRGISFRRRARDAKKSADEFPVGARPAATRSASDANKSPRTRQRRSAALPLPRPALASSLNLILNLFVNYFSAAGKRSNEIKNVLK